MKIVFSNGPCVGRVMEFALQEITIGREQGNILRIPAEGVSRFHARIFRKDDGSWWIQDQNSTNGVRVNRSRICGEDVLKEGDGITIGEQTLLVSDLSGAAPKVAFRPIVAPPTGEVPLPKDDTGFGAAPGTTVLDPESYSDAKFDARSGKREIFGGNLFPGEKRFGTAAEETSDPEARRRRFPLLFYAVIGICALVVILSVFLISGGGKRNPRSEKLTLSGAAGAAVRVDGHERVGVPSAPSRE